MAKFSIDVRFKTGLSATQRAVFQSAAARWAQIIVGDFPRIRIGGEVIEALVIDASGVKIDGKGRILGQAGPTHILPNGLPAKGSMEFDIADLSEMEKDGTLQSVILHEMGHVLGIGTVWQNKGVLAGSGSANPRFVGVKAGKEWAKLSHLPEKQLPVENKHGPGTADAHWRETIFGSELMTGFISGTTQPLSRMTIASLSDIGYKVSFIKADTFSLPSHIEVRAMGVGADKERVRRCSCSNTHRRKFTPKHYTEDALV